MSATFLLSFLGFWLPIPCTTFIRATLEVTLWPLKSYVGNLGGTIAGPTQRGALTWTQRSDAGHTQLWMPHKTEKRIPFSSDPHPNSQRQARKSIDNSLQKWLQKLSCFVRPLLALQSYCVRTFLRFDSVGSTWKSVLFAWSKLWTLVE